MSNKLYIKLFKSAVVLSLIGFVYSCANPVMPTGGPKDVTPPVELESEPQNFSTNFTEKSARIWFDEYVELKDLPGQLLVSPPLEKNPDVTTRGKSIVIKWEDTLLDNTTYTFFLGDAVVDITEKNPLKSFQYVFSTGAVIDSMELSGKLVDAFTKEPVENVMVMLYRSMEDSVPMKERPVYVSKTNKQGAYNFRNLADGGYKIFALVDANNNYLFDLPNEQIAFLADSVFPVMPKRPIVIDTITVDSTIVDSLFNDSIHADSLTKEIEKLEIPGGQIGDSLFADSLIQDSLVVDSLAQNNDTLLIEEKKEMVLLLFESADTVQKIVDTKKYLNRNFSIYFHQPTDSAYFNIIDKKGDFEFISTIWNKTKDSATVWMENFDTDSLELQVMDRETVIDTVVFTYFDLKEPDTTKVEKLKVSSNVSGTIELNQNLYVSFNHPVMMQHDSAFRFINGEDTISIGLTPVDSLKMKFLVNHTWESEKNYGLLIPDSAFTDIYGLNNDSTNFSFKARNIEDYTKIILSFETDYDSTLHIVQLLTEKGDVVTEKRLYKNQQIEFEYLQVKKYRLRAIIDLNGNGRWDVGDYIKNKQPEPVIYQDKIIETRANWDIESDWKIKKP